MKILTIVIPHSPIMEQFYFLIVHSTHKFSLGNAPLPFLSHLDYYFLYKWDSILEKNPSIRRYKHLDLLRDGWSHLSHSQQALFKELSNFDRKRYVDEMKKNNPSWDASEITSSHGSFLKKGVYRSPLFYYLWTQFYSHMSEYSEDENVNARLLSLFEKWKKLKESKKQRYAHLSLVYANEYSKEELKEGEICMSSFPIYPTAANYYCSILNEYRVLKDPGEGQIMDVLRSEYSKLSEKEKLPFITILNEVKEKRKEMVKAQGGQ